MTPFFGLRISFAGCHPNRDGTHWLSPALQFPSDLSRIMVIQRWWRLIRVQRRKARGLSLVGYFPTTRLDVRYNGLPAPLWLKITIGVGRPSNTIESGRTMSVVMDMKDRFELDTRSAMFVAESEFLHEVTVKSPPPAHHHHHHHHQQLDPSYHLSFMHPPNSVIGVVYDSETATVKFYHNQSVFVRISNPSQTGRGAALVFDVPPQFIKSGFFPYWRIERDFDGPFSPPIKIEFVHNWQPPPPAPPPASNHD